MNRSKFEIVSGRVVPVGKIEPQPDSWDPSEALQARHLAAERGASGLQSTPRPAGQPVLRSDEAISSRLSGDGELHPGLYGIERSRTTISDHE